MSRFGKPTLKWQFGRLEYLASLSNEDLLGVTIEMAQGDDYDGCFTEQGEWEFMVAQKLLEDRLIKCGFLPESSL